MNLVIIGNIFSDIYDFFAFHSLELFCCEQQTIRGGGGFHNPLSLKNFCLAQGGHKLINTKTILLSWHFELTSPYNWLHVWHWSDIHKLCAAHTCMTGEYSHTHYGKCSPRCAHPVWLVFPFSIKSTPFGTLHPPFPLVALTLPCLPASCPSIPSFSLPSYASPSFTNGRGL